MAPSRSEAERFGRGRSGLGPSGLQVFISDSEDKRLQEGFGIPGVLERRMNERLSQK